MSDHIPLIPKDKGPIIAAIITALGSMLVFVIGVMIHQDERLDRLEQIGHVLLDEQGLVRPSKEAAESFFRTEHLRERVERLEEKLLE